jgi:hypothetical protein
MVTEAGAEVEEPVVRPDGFAGLRWEAHIRPRKKSGGIVFIFPKLGVGNIRRREPCGNAC